MPRKSTKKTGPGAWKDGIGRRPRTVTAFERGDKGNSVWLRWNRPGTGLYHKMRIPGLTLRDECGRLLPERTAAATAAAVAAYNRLLNNEDPRTLAADKATPKAPLSVARGLDLALEIGGMYDSATEHYRDIVRYAAHIRQCLPPDVKLWKEVKSTTYRKLWRAIARWRRAEGERTRNGEITGRRAAEFAVVLLAQVARWLAAEGHLRRIPKLPPHGWQAQFVADWARITHDSVVDRDPPRHAAGELGLLYKGIDAGLSDPRIRLALGTAGEARLGQALRCDRTHLDLSAVGAYGLRRFTIPDTGKKLGVIIDLNPATRAMWDAALGADGYLGELEAAFREGRVRTCPCFPQGRLRAGKARSNATKPLTRNGALALFRELDELSGVAVVDGRGWYGVRRIAADLAEDVESDGRVLNAITGHTSDKMRRRIYQQKRRNKLLAEAADARTALRELAVAAAEQAPVELDLAKKRPSAFARRKEEKNLRRLESHPVPKGRKKNGKRVRLEIERSGGGPAGIPFVAPTLAGQPLSSGVGANVPMPAYDGPKRLL